MAGLTPVGCLLTVIDSGRMTHARSQLVTHEPEARRRLGVTLRRETTMADKSPKKPSPKKVGKSLKEKHAAKKAKTAAR